MTRTHRSTYERRLDELAKAGQLPIPKKYALELAARGLIDPDAELVPPQIITPTPTLDKRSRHFVPGAYFDIDAVERVIKALRGLRHTKGRRWANRPLNPEAWQTLWIIAPVFGWKNVAGLRIIRDCWIEIPRKNGKSTLASGLAIVLLCADGELGAEVYAAASSRDQAGQVFEPAKQMVTKSPWLRGKVEPLRGLLKVPATNSIFRVLSRIAETAHGLNVSGAVVDEVHVHKSRDLIDAIDTGTGAREQPLVIYITTSDDGKRTTIYAEKRDEVESLASDRGVPDHEHYGVVWAAPDDLDPFAIETIRMANPGIGVIVMEDYLIGKARKAQRTPSFMPTYERLHLNRRRSAIVRAIDMTQWDAGGEPPMSITELRAKLLGRTGFGGLDLATTEDFAAWAMVFPDRFQLKGEKVDGCWVLPRLWVTSAAVERRKSMRSTIEMWAEQGWVTIHPGTVLDFDLMEEDIGRDAEDFDIEEFAFDAWQAEMLRKHLMDGGLVGWKCGQTMERLAAPSQHIDRMLANHAVHHGGNPALAWMASNVVAKRDGQGRWKPEKELSAEKIDGFVAFDMGVAAWIRADRKQVHDPAGAPARAGGSRELFRPSGPLKI